MGRRGGEKGEMGDTSRGGGGRAQLYFFANSISPPFGCIQDEYEVLWEDGERLVYEAKETQGMVVEFELEERKAPKTKLDMQAMTEKFLAAENGSVEEAEAINVPTVQQMRELLMDCKRIIIEKDAKLQRAVTASRMRQTSLSDQRDSGPREVPRVDLAASPTGLPGLVDPPPFTIIAVDKGSFRNLSADYTDETYSDVESALRFASESEQHVPKGMQRGPFTSCEGK